MDICFPDPENPHISPTRDSLTQRRHLRYVFYGNVAMCIGKILVEDLLSGIFHLFAVWIAYCAWASMSYCTVLIQVIFTALRLITMMGMWGYYEQRTGDSLFLKAIVYSMFIFNLAALIISYRAYSCF